MDIVDHLHMIIMDDAPRSMCSVFIFNISTHLVPLPSLVHCFCSASACSSPVAVNRYQLDVIDIHRAIYYHITLLAFEMLAIIGNNAAADGLVTLERPWLLINAVCMQMRPY